MSPKGSRSARAPVAIRPLHAKTPLPGRRPPLPEKPGEVGECRDGQWVGVGGQYPTLWPVGR